MKGRHKLRQRATSFGLSVESLEHRLVFSGQGISPITDTQLTVSFAPDGTDIAGESSELHSLFDAITDDVIWQEAIVEALQTWAVHTNIDVGVVQDSGEAFGSDGSITNDPRFGDVRVGARPLASNVAAVSIPSTSFVGGTWGSDIVFNSNFDFQTVSGVFAVALHEAGNVYGLADNGNPESPLFPGGVPVATTPTVDDVLALQQIHGVRNSDLNEASRGNGPDSPNDSFRRATIVRPVEHENVEGGAPAIVHGDLRDNADVDLFRVNIPDGYHGSVTVSVHTDGFSSLRPVVNVFDKHQEMIGDLSGVPHDGSALQFATDVEEGEKLYVRIAGGDGVWGVGGYSLVASLDQRNVVSQAQVEAMLTGAYRSFHQNDMAQLLTGSDRFSEDGTNDEGSGVLHFKTDGISTATASIDRTGDVDAYSIRSPSLDTQDGLVPLTVAIISSDLGGLVPKIELQQRSGAGAMLADPTVLVNGGGVTVLQWDGVPERTRFDLVISATEETLFDTGNYDLTVRFGGEVTELESMVVGELSLDGNKSVHGLFLARPQLFHLVMNSDETMDVAPTLLSTSIVSLATDESEFDLVMPVGETRSGSGILLMPGEYQVVVSAITSDGNPVESPIVYSLSGLVLSDPLAIELDDGSDQPFACPAAGGINEFCYPGTATTTTNPFMWEGPTTTVETIEIDAGTISKWTEADWWNWYWSADGTGDAPVASPDSFQMNGEHPLVVDVQDGLLSNDSDPEDDRMAVVLLSEPTSGAVDVALDGSFVYSPFDGFVGVDQFVYQVTDFGGFSESRNVTIEVFSAGDIDRDHDTDATDIDRLALAIREDNREERFDLNSDGALTLDDQAHLLSLIGSMPGDANLDGVVDTIDYAVWNNNAFTTQTGWESGDFNADGVTDVSDFNIWNMYRFDVQPAAGKLTSRLPRAVPEHVSRPGLLAAIAPDSTILKNSAGTRSATSRIDPETVRHSGSSLESPRIIRRARILQRRGQSAVRGDESRGVEQINSIEAVDIVWSKFATESV